MTAVTVPADQVDALCAADGIVWLAAVRRLSTMTKSGYVPPAAFVGKCETCDGGGWVADFPPVDDLQCPTCGGSGLRRVEIGGCTFEVIEVLPVVYGHGIDRPPQPYVAWYSDVAVLVDEHRPDTDNPIDPIGSPTPGHYVVALRKVEL